MDKDKSMHVAFAIQGLPGERQSAQAMMIEQAGKHSLLCLPDERCLCDADCPLQAHLLRKKEKKEKKEERKKELLCLSASI